MKPAVAAISAALLLIVLILLSVLAGANKTSTDVFDAMSTTITVQLSGRRSGTAVKEIRAETERLENLLSMFVEVSDIYKINNGSGFIPLEPETCDMLEKCREYSTESDGIFDVTVGNITQLWGICSNNPSVPLPAEIADALKTVGSNIRLDIIEKDGLQGIINDGSLCIDPGGVAKGYVLDRFREILDSNRIKNGIISIGGNVLVYGDNEGKNYSVGLRIPAKYSEGYFCALKLCDTVVSTSGGYERFFTAPDGTEYNHIIDPRTGYPVDNELLSVSVICKDASRADYLSTRLFILGEDGAAELISELAESGIYVVIVNEDNIVRCSSALEDIMPSDKRSLDYTFIFE